MIADDAEQHDNHDDLDAALTPPETQTPAEVAVPAETDALTETSAEPLVTVAVPMDVPSSRTSRLVFSGEPRLVRSSLVTGNSRVSPLSLIHI